MLRPLALGLLESLSLRPLVHRATPITWNLSQLGLEFPTQKAIANTPHQNVIFCFLVSGKWSAGNLQNRFQSQTLMSEITQLLERARNGDPNATEELLPLVYNELRKLAGAKLAREEPGQTLQPTALVHEAWLRLGGNTQPNWENRAHFFGAAAEAMRRILIERARAKGRLRRGGDWTRVDLDLINLAAEDADDSILALDEALQSFEKVEPLKARVVKLRYFIGLTHDEVAKAMNLSEPTIRRYWTFARAWLYAELKTDRSSDRFGK